MRGSYSRSCPPIHPTFPAFIDSINAPDFDGCLELLKDWQVGANECA